MIAGTHDVIDLQFSGCVRLAAGADLPSALEPGSVLSDHLEPGAGGGVKIGLWVGEAVGGGGIECSGHAGVPVVLINFRMAVCADSGVYVLVRAFRGVLGA